MSVLAVAAALVAGGWHAWQVRQARAGSRGRRFAMQYCRNARDRAWPGLQ